MKILFCIVAQSIALWLDLFFANNGYQGALSAVIFVYIIITYNWIWALPFGLISFVVYDNLMDLGVTNCVLFFIFIGVWWRNNGDCSRLWLMFIPCVGVIFSQYTFMYFSMSLDSFLVVKAMFVSLFITVPVGLFLMKIFNVAANYLGLPQSSLNEDKQQGFFNG